MLSQKYDALKKFQIVLLNLSRSNKLLNVFSFTHTLKLKQSRGRINKARCPWHLPIFTKKLAFVCFSF